MTSIAYCNSASHMMDGGSHLRWKREIFLQELLATLLPLADLLGPSKSDHSAPAPMTMFLLVLSLPMGRKLLSCYHQLLMPGSELTHVGCMAFFCHLRFRFGVLPLEYSAAESTMNLVKSISSCIHGMDLNALSACLAAVVYSSAQPPVSPLGSSAGDGASVIIKSVLDRATELLTDHDTAISCSIPSRNMWQASSDSFFGLLMKCRLSTYDRIMQSLKMQAPNAAVIGSEVTQDIIRDMPVDSS
ncbi:hypothetical protein B296_00023551 [Ensete ventricosum]|uniref:Uncharacterized protein n=1 Tax=Ensete ventricosum TaxID=4639 RepID=A0A426ZMD7_ENSVE|nr:hypothetical protein B296_00023551 [Ensete ventricosum]